MSKNAPISELSAENEQNLCGTAGAIPCFCCMETHIDDAAKQRTSQVVPVNQCISGAESDA